MASKLISLIQGQTDGLTDTISLIENLGDGYDLDKAEGLWLDLLNSVVGGTPRDTTIKPTVMSDSELRTRIKAKIEMNKGDGTLTSLADTVRYYLYLSDSNSWSSVKLTILDITYSSCNIYVRVSNIVSSDKVGQIYDFVGAGIGLYIIADDELEPFACADEDGNVTVGYGLGETFDGSTPSLTGGKLSEIIGW